MANPRWILWFGVALVVAFLLQPVKSGAHAPQQGANSAGAQANVSSNAPAAPQPEAPVHLTAEQDHQRIMDLLHITSLRRGADGDPKSPNAANYDEAKANPYPKLPDPLRLNNGKEVKTAKDWWQHRRPEIVEDFDREIYGRAPQTTPKVTWEVASTSHEMNGDVPVIAKNLIGHVDNSKIGRAHV